MILPVGTELPSMKTIKFKTSEPDQRSVQLQIIEGTDPKGTRLRIDRLLPNYEPATGFADGHAVGTGI